MQMMIMLDAKESMLTEEAVKSIPGCGDGGRISAYQSMFHDYVRGGVEELYERLIIQKQNRTVNFMIIKQQI